jgi:hypothetical protein
MLSILLHPRSLPGLLVGRYEHSRTLKREARRDKGLAGALRPGTAPEGDGSLRLASRSGVAAANEQCGGEKRNEEPLRKVRQRQLSVTHDE